LKICSRKDCDQVNPQSLENFKRKPKYKYGIYPQCKHCVNRLARERRKNNPEQAKIKDKREYWKSPEFNRQKARFCRFRKKYWPNLTYKEAGEEWQKLHDAQKGLCASCKEPKLLDVDHCHSTRKVRGLLCNDCNTSLARLHESVEKAKNLIVYIETKCK
jgi:Recombination endonuclease VII